MEKISNSDTSIDDKKQVHQSHSETDTPHTPPEYVDAPHFDGARTKKLLRKLDWHLVPFLALLYL